MKSINVVGAGLAGSEAAYYLLSRGYEVHLYERRPLVLDGAHLTGLYGELVCSNSLKSKSLENACGLLKEEMRIMGSITMQAASESEVPSGNALSVDRDLFASKITTRLNCFSNLVLHNEEIDAIPEGITILATGPLTGDKLMETLGSLVGQKSLSFFDASAPIVKKDSIDFSKAYFKSRYEQGDESYINCPFTKEEYSRFVEELTHAERALLHEFDTNYFEGCLPVEIIASRGFETLRHGPLKPFGLSTPEHPKPYAVAQLRQDTLLGDYFNIVGFQTNLTYPEQKRVFRMIPGLENAEFLRFGLMHRNSYLDAPRCLNEDLTLKNAPNVYIAGQLSGVEGYVESAAMGIYAAINAARKIESTPPLIPSSETILGALVRYITHCTDKYFSPMNANWALIPSSQKKNRQPSIDASLAATKLFWEQANG